MGSSHSFGDVLEGSDQARGDYLCNNRRNIVCADDAEVQVVGFGFRSIDPRLDCHNDFHDCYQFFHS